MISLARKNLLKDLPRFLVAQAGIVFAVSLVTIQAGIFAGFTRSTTLLIENSDADIWVAADEMVNFELTEPLPLALLPDAREVAGVERVEPLLVGSGRWYPEAGAPTTLRIFGFDPEGTLFNPGAIARERRESLSEPYTAIVDESNLNAFGIEERGDTAQIRSLPVEVVGITSDTQSLVSSKFVFASLTTAHAYTAAGYSAQLRCQLEAGGLNCTNDYQRQGTAVQPQAEAPEPLSAETPISYILVQAAPDADLAALKQRLVEALPGTQAYTRAELVATTQRYWQQRTGIGFILGLGATVGAIVGMAIVAQILYTSVSEHLKEFATLKAIGASDRVIYGTIVEQSLWMAVLGYLPGMALCLGVSHWALTSQGILILITPTLAVGVFGVTTLMCVGSGFFAIQKVMRLDPSLVFKA